MAKLQDLTGRKFYSLTIVSKANGNVGGSAKWNCLCECGNTCVTDSKTLKRGDKKSCGCGKSKYLESIKGKGLKVENKREYDIHKNMKSRCFNKSNKSYPAYGGRGITVCKEWLSFSGFMNDMGKCPDGYSLERIDVNNGYCKDNCKWIPLSEQVYNRRDTIKIDVDGEMIPALKLAREKGLDYQFVRRLAKKGLKLSSI